MNKQASIVEMCAAVAIVQLVSLWPWPLTSDLDNLSSNVNSDHLRRPSSFTEIPSLNEGDIASGGIG